MITTILPMVLVTLISTSAIAASVTLAWDPNDPTPDGYIIHIRVDGNSYNYNAPVWIGTATSCHVDGLIPGTTYFIVVRAYVGELRSGDSNEVTFAAKEATSDTAASEDTDIVSETERNVTARISAMDNETTAGSIPNSTVSGGIPNVKQLRLHRSSD
jgi:hypothetical protein